MAVLDSLESFRGGRLPLVRQTEGSECGLACLAMIAAYHGHRVSLGTMRRRFPISAKGVTIFSLITFADRLGLACRPVRVPLEALGELALPALLHWNLNHFVVLKSISSKKAVIHDPAQGVVELPLSTISERFTGFALEFEPTGALERRDEREVLRVRQLWTRIYGLKRSLLLLGLLSLTLQALILIAPLFTQLVVDNVLGRDDVDLLNVLLIGFGMVAIGRAVVEMLRDNLLVRTGSVLSFQIVMNLFRHMMRLPHDYFEKRHIGDIVSRFGSTEVLRKMLTEDLVASVVDGLTATLTLTLMFFYSPRLALVSIFFLLIYCATRAAIFKRARAANEEAIFAKAEENTSFMETVRGILSIKVAHREEDRVRRWQPKWARVVNAYAEVGKLKVYQGFAKTLLFGIEFVLIIYLGAKLVLAGGFSVGMLFAFVFYRLEFIDKSVKLVERSVDFAMLRLHMERLSDIALNQPEDLGGPDTGNRRLQGGVELRGVSFAYAPDEPAVLHDVSFSIAPGESVAITGPSGCGKTTMAKLILGLMQPTAGTILIDGLPLDTFGRRQFRTQVGAVMQDDQLFGGSIAENIAFATEVDDDKVRHCARLAAIDFEIEQMPMQYETLVGDMGTVLSGGQKQRILLARALYREPRLLILDEGTSHLDARTESVVNQSVRSLGVTRLIIAHRLETILSADRILLFDRGRLVQEIANGGEETRRLIEERGLQWVQG